MNINIISLLIKYSSLLYIIFYSVSFDNVRLYSVLYLLFILIFILLNHIRYFNFKNKISMHIISLIELIIINTFINIANVYTPILFIPILADYFLLCNKKYKYLFIIPIFLLNLFLSLSIADFNGLYLFTLICILLEFIYRQNIIKKSNQIYFDKIKLSESKLKNDNNELRLYSDTIEELSILNERNRISREIHDNVGHALSTTIIQLSALEKLTKDNDIKEMIHELREFVKNSLSEVRLCVSDLKPKSYSNYKDLFKIKELINDFNKLTNINIKLITSKITWELCDEQSFVLYRVIQESLSNCAKHSNCSNIKLYMTYTSDFLTITISDDGYGCNDIVKGNGLNSITERINEINGHVLFSSNKNGFTTKITCPKYIGGNNIE